MRNFDWYFFIYLALWRWEELVGKWCGWKTVNVQLKSDEASHFPETIPTKWGTRKGKTPKALRSWYTRQMGNFVKNDIWSRREGDFSCVERRRKQLKMKGKCPLATFLSLLSSSSSWGTRYTPQSHWRCWEVLEQFSWNGIQKRKKSVRQKSVHWDGHEHPFLGQPSFRTATSHITMTRNSFFDLKSFDRNWKRGSIFYITLDDIATGAHPRSQSWSTRTGSCLSDFVSCPHWVCLKSMKIENNSSHIISWFCGDYSDAL